VEILKEELHAMEEKWKDKSPAILCSTQSDQLAKSEL
jgi:hypothetical protein